MSNSIKLFNGDPEILRPIVESWQRDVDTNEFEIKVDAIDRYLIELAQMSVDENSDLIVLYDNNEPIGYIGLQYFNSPIGNQKMANEHYYYVLPEKRSMASMRLLRCAKYIAKQRGCSHIIFNASNLASKLHDKICRLYERLDFKKFETSYITKLNGESEAQE